ncbi:MAG: hypothetical protein AAB131_17475 [Actinomycetota bacterium]
MKHRKLRLILATSMLSGLGVVGAVAQSTTSAFAYTCNGTGWRSNAADTAYSDLVSIYDPDCRHKAAAFCNGGWYAASTWKQIGQVSSKLCPNSWDITNNGWYTNI